jgi:hypothetical protein
MKFSPFPCYLVPLSPKYSPQHPILKHPQLLQVPSGVFIVMKISGGLPPRMSLSQRGNCSFSELSSIIYTRWPVTDTWFLPPWQHL